jgi:hypothetical protein
MTFCRFNGIVGPTRIPWGENDSRLKWGVNPRQFIEHINREVERARLAKYLRGDDRQQKPTNS